MFDDDKNTKTYRVYNREHHKILISCDIVYDENKLGMSHLSSTKIHDNISFPINLESLSDSQPSVVA